MPGNDVRGPAPYRFPPGFQRNLLWFALRKFRPANPILLFQHLAQAYGDIAHYKIGWHHIVFLNHPDYIREVPTESPAAKEHAEKPRFVSGHGFQPRHCGEQETPRLQPLLLRPRSG